jgi:rhamnogalacturonyl hydrolase YesR
MNRNLMTLSFSARDLLKTTLLEAVYYAWPGQQRPFQTLPDRDAGVLTAKETLSILRLVCDWQLTQLTRFQNNRWAGHLTALAQFDPRPQPFDHWTTATLWAGIMALYQVSHENRYLKTILDQAEAHQWRPGSRPRHADDHCIGQTYIELYLLKNDPRMIGPIRETFDRMMADPRPGRQDWWWCDALFMAPPVLAGLSAVTGDPTYLDFMNAMWWDATDFLYDPAEHLFFRDENYRIDPDGSGRRELNGQKIFWGRGNGWVMAGLVRILHFMPPAYPDRARYVNLLQQMAGKVASLQSRDGLWQASLLAPDLYPTPETSGSALICYSLAWGINQGLLSSESYQPVVDRAWQGLLRAVHTSGKLGWVQQIGSRPKSVSRYDTEVYGVGAFLLAGSEMLKLRSKD